MKKQGRQWRIGILSALVTVVFLVFLFRQIDVREVYQALARASIFLVLLGFLLYITSAMLRAGRYYFLLQKAVRLWPLFQVVTIQTMVINIIPNLVGEFSFLYLVKRLGNIRSGQSFVTMILARLFDLLAIFSLFIFFVIIAESVPSFMLRVLWVFSAVLALVLVFFFMLFFMKERLCNSLRQCFAALHLTNIKLFALFLQKIHESAEAAERIKSARTLLSCYLLSLAIWLVSFTNAYVLIKAARYTFSYPVVALGTTFSKLMSTLPIYGIAGLGTTEGFWSLGFLALGADKTAAIVTGFSVHLFTLLYTLILGAFFMVKNRKAIF